MPYYVNVDEGPSNPTIEDFTPSFRESLDATVGSAWAGNVTPLALDYLDLQRANQGQRLDRTSAEQIVKDAGARIQVPDSGYTREALDLLIKRQQDQNAREDVLNRTPWSLTGSPVRGIASLVTGLLDPVNVAAAFFPVVGEARAASMLANAGGSALARAGARTVIGAAEGAAGAAVLEPAVYGLHQQLQDDYSMANSLQNVAFGGLLGGGLHLGMGVLADAMRGGAPDPNARFAGLDTARVQRVMDFERQRAANPAMDVGAATANFDAQMRRAAGLEQPAAAPGTEPAAASGEPATPEAQGRPGAGIDLAQAPEAPFPKLATLTDAQAHASALGEMRDELHAELLGEASARAEPGVIADTRRRLGDVQQQLRTLDDTFKPAAKDFQRQGMSRKEAEAAARKQIADQRSNLEATQQRLQGQVDENARAAGAEQDIAALDKGQVPERFAARVQERAAQIKGASDLARAALGSEPQTPAHWVVGMASPQTRQLALRTAVADMAQGRIPDVESLVRSDAAVGGAPMSPDDLRARTERQEAPQSLAVGDADAARAAAARLKQPARATGGGEAETALQEAMDRFTAARDNLALGGFSEERLAQYDETLRPFDDAVQAADGLGQAARAAALCGIRS